MIRSTPLLVVAIFAASACGGEQPLAARHVMNTEFIGNTAASQVASVGDQVVLWEGYSIDPAVTFDVVVTEQGESEPGFCAVATTWYRVRTTLSSMQSGHVQWFTTAPLVRGTRLRFVGHVGHCDGGFYGFAFEVIAVPGK